MRSLPLRRLSTGAAAAALGLALSAQDVIQVTGTAALVRTDGTASSYSRDGGSTWVTLPANHHVLNWRDRSFDPRVGDPGVPPALLADAQNQLFYVQFVTDIVPEYADALRQLGADYTRYYPHQAYVVRMPRDRAAAVREQAWVRAVMDLETGHKLDQQIQVDLLSGVLETARYNIVLVDKRRDAPALEARIAAVGGTLMMRAEGGILVEATLTPAQLMAVARENTVLWIDRWTEGEIDMDNARIQAGVNYVEAQAGIDGKGIRGHINEGIFSHVEFAAQPPYRTAGINLLPGGGSSHGTNTAGEIYAMGLPGGVKGVLPFAQLIWTNRGPNRYAMVEDLVDPAQPYQAMMMTQSWGGSRTTAYTSISALMDDILFDFDHMFATNSQSNSGGTPSRPEAWAKNVAGIGGFLHRNNSSPTDDCWCNTGSTGPAQDGRVGVSYTGYYDNIHTTDGTTGYTNGFGGTSGATPIVNGLAGAALQMFTDGLFGYHPGGVGWQNRFANTPNLTTTRVLLAMGTRQLAFTGTNRATRVQQGFGFPNLQDLYDNRNNILLLDEEDVLVTGQQRNYLVWVKPGTAEFRASMHHLEDAAVPSAIPTRINSLDLQVRAPNGTTYWGNDGNATGILQGPWSAPGGAANDRDLHENVFIQNPLPGQYRVSVRAAAVRQDSHKETGAVDADFALAIRGIGGGRDRSGMTVDLVSSTPGQLTVQVGNVPATGWTRGYTVMSFDTRREVSLGALFGVEGDLLTEHVLRRPASAGDVFSFTNAGASQYPFVSFTFPNPLVSGRRVDATVVLLNGNDLVAAANVSRVTVQ